MPNNSMWQLPFFELNRLNFPIAFFKENLREREMMRNIASFAVTTNFTLVEAETFMHERCFP